MVQKQNVSTLIAGSSEKKKILIWFFFFHSFFLHEKKILKSYELQNSMLIKKKNEEIFRKESALPKVFHGCNYTLCLHPNSIPANSFSVLLLIFFCAFTNVYKAVLLLVSCFLSFCLCIKKVFFAFHVWWNFFLRLWKTFWSSVDFIINWNSWKMHRIWGTVEILLISKFCKEF